MKVGDTQLGKPQVLYKDTKSNIEALSGIVEGAMAYATDTDIVGLYNGSSWVWPGSYVPVTVTGLTDSASGNWGNGSSKAQGTYTFRPGDNSNLWPATAKALHVFVFAAWAAASASSIISLRRASGGTNEAQVRGLVAGVGYGVNVNIALDGSGYFYAVVEGANTTSGVCRVLGYYT